MLRTKGYIPAEEREESIISPRLWALLFRIIPIVKFDDTRGAGEEAAHGCTERERTRRWSIILSAGVVVIINKSSLQRAVNASMLLVRTLFGFSASGILVATAALFSHYLYYIYVCMCPSFCTRRVLNALRERRRRSEHLIWNVDVDANAPGSIQRQLDAVFATRLVTSDLIAQSHLLA